MLRCRSVQRVRFDRQRREIFRKSLMIGVLFAASTAFALASEAEQVAGKIDVRTSDLETAPPAANWLTYHGDYSGRRYSALSEIGTGNVGQLRAQWVFHCAQLEAS